MAWKLNPNKITSIHRLEAAPRGKVHVQRLAHSLLSHRKGSGEVAEVAVETSSIDHIFQRGGKGWVDFPNPLMQKPVNKLFIGMDPTHTKFCVQNLRERTSGNNPPSPLVVGHHRRGTGDVFVVVQEMVRIIGKNIEVMLLGEVDQAGLAHFRHANPGRIVEVGDGVHQLWAPPAGDLVLQVRDIHPTSVQRDSHLPLGARASSFTEKKVSQKERWCFHSDIFVIVEKVASNGIDRL